MTIRARLTLWYVGIMFASLLAMGALSYRHFVAIPAHGAMRGRESPDEVADKAMDFREVAQIGLWSGVPALLLALAGGWWLTRKALSPVAALTQAAERVNERSLREQLPRSGSGDELDRLTEVFNAMTARLDGSFQRVREFTLHASHELKTPLTILRGELESALREEEKGAPPRPGRLLSQMDEIDRLTKIVDGLTLLTKADAGQVALHLEPVRLDELVRESFADANILAQPSGIRVFMSACEEIPLQGDRHRLRQLLLNLTDNSIKHNQPGGVVDISLRRAGGMAELQISNTGAGLAPELHARVFERFFRGDASHNREVEGCGLGLSIAQWIVTAHGGAIRFDSTPGKLTTLVVRLPLEGAGAPVEERT
ncbi:MAG: ATP-binding protein [Verrucomicrobiota bacterium]|jgi:signal transduction histidine kinase